MKKYFGFNSSQTSLLFILYFFLLFEPEEQLTIKCQHLSCVTVLSVFLYVGVLLSLKAVLIEEN